MKNSNLHEAKKAKNDEFYTQLSDIEREMKYYRPHFEGKVVLCNCNDALHTGFAMHFSMAFHVYGLKELICTSFNPEGHGTVYRYHGDTNENGIPDIEEWEQMPMEGNGGFNTPEGIALIDEADIIVTNPPFSLFREFIALLMEHNKKFLILGNMNAITYKEVFPLIKDNKIWAGYKCFGGGMNMIQPEDTFDESKTKSFTINEKGEIIKNIMGVIWFTNLDHKKRHEPLILYKRYTPEEFPKYDNYDAIEVSKVCEIPEDYKGVMGVPISFLDKYCPEQFEIIKFRKGDDDKDLSVNGKCPYFRMLIKSK